MAERFFGNMTDEEYEEWKSLSQEEKVAMARELAIEKRKAKKIKEAEDSAYWKNYRKKAMTTEHGSISDEPHFEETYSADSPYATLAKAKADEDLGLSEKTISRGPQNMGDYVSDYASNAWDSFDLGKTLGDWGVTGDLKETTAKINRENTPIPENVILEARSARKLNERPYDAEEFLEIEEEPISEADQEFIDNSRKAAEFSGLSRVDDGAINPEEQAADARRFQREYEEAAFPSEPSWTDHLVAGADGDAMRKIDDSLGRGPSGTFTNPAKLKLAAAAFLKSKGAPDAMIDVIPTVTKKELESLKSDDKKEEKKEKGLIDLTQKELKDAEKDTEKELKKMTKKEKLIEELSPTHVPPKKEMDIGGETSDPWMQQSDKFKLDYDPTFLAPKILDYQAAKTDTEREEVLKDTGKDERAAIREEADPKCFWVDPRTGYALNTCEMDKRMKRKEEIELAKLFPPADRAVYLARKKVITQGDLTAMLDPTELEQLDILIKKQKAQEGAYTLISAKLKSEEDPKRKEWIKMYLNAGSNDNYGLQVLLGTKLGFGKDIMEAAQKAHLINEKAKLASKGGGLKKAFSGAYGVEYSTVVANEMKWIDRATAIVQKDGIMSEYQMDGVTIRDRSGRFRSYGLKEHTDMKDLSPKEQETIYKKSPYYKRMIKNKNFLDADGNFDPTRLTKDKDSYERYLLDTLVWMAMEDLYNEKYTDMMKYVDEHSFAYQRSKASMEKKLTADKQE